MAQGPIFTRQDTAIGGVFSSDKAKLTFGASSGVQGTLVQGLNFNYQQQVTRLYEIGNDQRTEKVNIYYVGGRTQGSAQLNRVIGPKATIVALYKRFGNVCNACKNKLELQLNEADCCNPNEDDSPSNQGRSSQSIVYILKGCVLIQVGISLNANDMVINEQCQLMYSGLDYDDNGAFRAP